MWSWEYFSRNVDETVEDPSEAFMGCYCAHFFLLNAKTRLSARDEKFTINDAAATILR